MRGNNAIDAGGVNSLPLYKCIANLDAPPIALVILGVPGTGKSVVATSLARLLRMYRVINTDYVREILRYKSDESSFPFLFGSAFEAWNKLGEPTEENIVKGWSLSRDTISDTVMHLMRMEFERKRDFIVEGTLAPRPSPAFLTIGYCVYVLLTVRDIEERRRRLEIKVRESRGKEIERWFTTLEVTQKIQAQLLQEATQNGYIVIENKSLSETIRRIKNIPISVVKNKD